MVVLTGCGERLVGEEYTLYCKINGTLLANGGAETLTYGWTKDGNIVTGETSKNLHFSYLRLSDHGHYMCEVSRNGNSTLVSNSLLLRVEGKSLKV